VKNLRSGKMSRDFNDVWRSHYGAGGSMGEWRFEY
jgi:hypothetical protein